MTQEEKQLLLVDLCARLPYMVKCKASHGLGNTDKKHEYIGVLKFVGNCYGVIANYYEDVPHDTGLINNVFYDIEYIKPYLRPMSSMTEEELDELLDCEDIDFDGKSELVKRAMLAFAEGDKLLSNALFSMQYAKTVDWLNSHHFDYRGLIEKGLALEAPDGMYNTKIK